MERGRRRPGGRRCKSRDVDAKSAGYVDAESAGDVDAESAGYVGAGVGAGGLLDTGRAAPHLPPRARAGLAELAACMKDLASQLEIVPLPELARVMLSRTGLYEMYRTRDRSDGTSKTANLEEMVSDMASYGTGPDALPQFLESVALASPLDTKEAEAEDAEVTLITLHNTKGLEFDRVIITGLEEGIFPHQSSGESEEDLEEERRIFYVGITRARDRLVMTWCLSRRIFGRTTDMTPSRFLDEVPAEAVQRIGEERIEEAADDYPVGGGVFHDEYGPGVVERKWYDDGALLVQVRFQSGRVAKFLPKYARLERIHLGE